MADIPYPRPATFHTFIYGMGCKEGCADMVWGHNGYMVCGDIPWTLYTALHTTTWSGTTYLWTLDTTDIMVQRVCNSMQKGVDMVWTLHT